MKRIILTLAALLVGSSAFAQTGTAVKQSGYVTPGHVPMWTTSGVIQDGGTAANGFLSSLGVTASGPGLCQNSGPVTGPYNALCFAPTQTGGGFTWYSYGGASGVPSMTINGTVYPFPFTAPGGIIGPATTVVGCAAPWANTVGTLLGNNCALSFAGIGTSLTVNPTLSNATVGTATANLWDTSTFAGSINSATLPIYAIGYALPLNLINVSSDNVNAAAPAGNTSDVPAFLCNHSFGGTNTVGSRSCIDANLILTATTGNAATNPYNGYYNVIVATGIASANDGGTSGSPSGYLSGTATQISLGSGATYWSTVHGAGEWDMAVEAGASVGNKIGGEIALTSADAVQGSNIDAAILFTNFGSVGWQRLFSLAPPSGGSFPLSSTGTIMGSPISGTANYGIDFSNIAFSNCAFSAGSSHAFCVDSAGAINNSTGLSTTGFITFFNTGAVYPTSAATTGAFGNNFTGGDRDVDSWNLDSLATVSFLWYQKTGASAATELMALGSTGTLTLASTYDSCNALTTNSGGVVVCGTYGTGVATALGNAINGTGGLAPVGSPIFTGTFNINGISGAGAASKYVCIDSSGNVLTQSGAC